MSYTSLKNKVVITRKSHRCAWCAEIIDTRNDAAYRAYLYDGEFDHDWMHPECADAMRQLDEDVDFTWMPGEFRRGKCYA